MSTEWIIFDIMGDFSADFEISSFAELPQVIERVFE